MAQIAPAIEREVKTADAEVRAMTSMLARRGGKRIRPALTLLTAELGGPDADRSRALRAAAALEMLHLASLHHDDVMDRATQRRHGRSVNATWGERAAV